MSFFEDDPVGPALERVAHRIDNTGSALLRGLQALATGASTLAFTPAAIGLGVFTAGLVGAVGALRSITGEAGATARALASIRAQTGLSFSQGYGLTSRNSLFGMSPEQTAQIYGSAAMNPLMAGVRGAAYGFGNPYSAGYLPQAAQHYQAMASRGPMGRLFANQMLDASYGGRAPDEIRQTLNLRPSQISAQLAYGSRVQSQMGISPEMLRRYAEEIPLASQRVAFAVNMAKQKLAVELAPAIEKGIGTVATFIAQNADKIARGIERGVHWLVYDLPPMMLRGGAQILRGGAFLLDGLSTFAKGIAGSVRPILTVFDAIINGVRTFAGALAGAAAFIIQGVGSLLKGLEGTGLPALARNVGQRLTGNQNKTPEEQLTNGIVGGVALKAALPVATSAAGIGLGAWARGAAGGGRSASGIASMWARSASFLERTPLTRAAGSGLGTGYLRALSAPVVGIGTALGVGGYEAMRHYNVLGYGSMPSTAQILGYYSGVTDSPTQQAARAYAAQRERAQSGGLSAFGYREGRSVFDAFGEGRDALYANWGQSNMAGNPELISHLQHLFGSASDMAGNGSKSLLGLASKADAEADSWKKNRDEDMRRILREIANNTKDGAKAQSALNQNMPTYLRQMTSRVAAYIAEDAALNSLRIG